MEYSHTGDKYTAGDGKEFVDDADEGALKSNSAGMNSTTVTVTVTFLENAPKMLLSFDYKVSSEGSAYNDWDGIKINGGKTICGIQSTSTTYERAVHAGEQFTIAFKRADSGAGGSD